jgi:hypothetical protein
MKAVRYNGSMSRELLRNEQIVLYDILVECGTIEAVK